MVLFIEGWRGARLFLFRMMVFIRQQALFLTAGAAALLAPDLGDGLTADALRPKPAGFQPVAQLAAREEAVEFPRAAPPAFDLQA